MARRFLNLTLGGSMSLCLGMVVCEQERMM